MTVIKKKDLKKYKPKQEIDELVNGDASPIEGDSVDSPNLVKVAPGQTGDDFAKQAIQAPRFYGAFATSHHYAPIKDSIEDNSEKESIDEIAKERMKDMIEAIVNKQDGEGIVNRTISPDVNRNGIPDIEELANSIGKPAAARHTQIFIYDITKTPLTGDEKAIILNYVLSNFNTTDISPDYKAILKSKL